MASRSAAGRGRRKGVPRGSAEAVGTPFDFNTNAPGLASGEVVNGQYEILGPIAHGGLGWIYLGRDRSVSNRWVVLKGMLNANDPDAAAAAAAERRFLAEIEHARIVNIYNFVTHRGAGYIVMEFVGGESLNSKLKARRKQNNGKPDPLPVPQAISYILGVLPAFGYLHERGLVYNDLKPANVMAVGDDVKLIDLGAVMRADDPGAAIFGTEGFQAPEVATEGPSPASDIYTIGRTLVVLTLDFVYHKGPLKNALPGPDAEPLFGQWESYYRFLLKSTAPHPDDRFIDTAEMAEQLLGVLAEIVAVSTGTPVQTTSRHFGADRLSGLLADAGELGFDPAQSDWRVLPDLRINPDDPAAGFLGSVGEPGPQKMLQLIDDALRSGAISETVEVGLARAQALIETGSGSSLRSKVAEPILAKIEQNDPWEWRVQWLRGLGHLLDGNWVESAERFSRVWTDLPGEIAPKMAVALAAERAGELERAADIYSRVMNTDRTYVSAAFGLARCRSAAGDRSGAVDAYQAVPTSSATYQDAQLAATRTLAGTGASQSQAPPTAEELTQAAQIVERMQLDALGRSEMAADILSRALANIQSGQISESSDIALLGHPLEESSIREGLELAYREMARYETDGDRKVELIDAANSVRPKSLI